MEPNRDISRPLIQAEPGQLTFHIDHLEVVEGEAITDPATLAALQLPPHQRPEPVLVDVVDELIESVGLAITDPAELERLRKQVIQGRQAG